MQAVQHLIERSATLLQRKLLDALNLKRLLSEAGSGPTSLLQGGGRAVAASARVQACHAHLQLSGKKEEEKLGSVNLTPMLQRACFKDQDTIL